VVTISGNSPTGIRGSGETTDPGRRFGVSELFECDGEHCQRIVQMRETAGVVVIVDRWGELVERHIEITLGNGDPCQAHREVGSDWSVSILDAIAAALRPGCWVTPRTAATASGTADGSPTDANSTSHTPSGKSLHACGNLYRQPSLADSADSGRRDVPRPPTGRRPAPIPARQSW
jgi:hypothetical protein